jgi:hypothetical protein
VFSHQYGLESVLRHHHHKHPELGHLARFVSRVTVALSIVSSVSQMFSFLVGCSEMILKGFGFVAFFAGVKASSFSIHLSCLVCCLSVVRGEWSRLFCGHKGRNLPEVSINSFLPPLLRIQTNYATHTAFRMISSKQLSRVVNSLNAELNPICHLLVLLGAHPILHISRITVKSTVARIFLCFNLFCFFLYSICCRNLIYFQ